MNLAVDPILRPLLESSHFPTYMGILQQILIEEEQKRRDFYEWLDEDKRAEFLLGEIVIHSPARWIHGLVLKDLERHLDDFLIENHIGMISREMSLIRLERSDVMPDMAFWPKEISDGFTSQTKLFPVPEFVIEVLSPSTEKIDRGRKMSEYASNGVREYWLVDADTQTIEQYENEHQLYKLVKKYSRTESITAIVLKGLELSLTKVFRE